MASTKTQSKSSNGTAPAASAAVRDVGDTAVEAAKRARGPLLAVSAAAAGLAGGLAAGSQRGVKRRGVFDRRPRVLGVPLGRKSGALKAVELLRDGARHLDSTTDQLSGAANDVHEIRAQLDQANHQSPIEVVLDALTHRRGAHKHER
jgi:hypothetical protein